MSRPLRGVAWRHTRAMAPLQSLAWVLGDRAGEDVVTWDTRSLKSFGEDPLDLFTADYDLIVFDYPFSGEALAQGWLRPMDTLLSAETINRRRVGAVGRALHSFDTADGVAALPIDAACYVRAWRPDLLEAIGQVPPVDWDTTVALAQQTGRVIMPLTPMAVWGALISLCAAGGSPPLHTGSVAFDPDAANDAWNALRRLTTHLPDECFDSSPVRVLNRMSNTDDFLYCPMTYGYSTYAMSGYSTHRLKFGDLAIAAGAPAGGAILGGAGIGVSALSPRPEAAAELAAWLTSDGIQSTLYGQCGGQPAAAVAWDDPFQNQLAGGFYSDTRLGMDRCYHRPNGPGFHAFQVNSANRLHEALRTGRALKGVLQDIETDWSKLPPRRKA